MDRTHTKSTNTAANIIRKLEDCKKNLQQGNLFSSLVHFIEALESYQNEKNFQSTDKSRLAAAMNNFQRQLVISQFFNDIYGKVQFRDNDFPTSYDFLCQLIKTKEDEIADVLLSDDINRKLHLDKLSKDDQKTVKRMVALVERGESTALREMVGVHDDLGTLVLNYYNEAGIDWRISGNIDKAILEYKKALTVSPRDENLYYNLARAYFEKGEKKNAEASIGQALQLNPDFKEGMELYKHIKKKAD